MHQTKTAAIQVFSPPVADTARQRAFADAEIVVGLGMHSESHFWEDLEVDGVTGIFVATYEHIEIGTPIWVEMWFPGGHHTGALAAVEWMRPEHAAHELPPGLGLQFEHLSDEARLLINHYTRFRPALFHSAA